MYQYETPQDQNVDRGSAFFIYLTGFAFLAFALHVIQWNQYAGEIIPLKIKDIAGIATPVELYREAQICGKLHKFDCQKTLLTRAFQGDSRNETVALELGEFNVRVKNWVDASSVYATYLRNGGKNLQARVNYAIALSELNRFKEAKKQFQHVIRVNKDLITQADYIRTYVHYLIQNKDYVTARSLIFETRAKSQNAAYFLEKEMIEIDARLKKSS